MKRLALLLPLLALVALAAVFGCAKRAAPATDEAVRIGPIPFEGRFPALAGVSNAVWHVEPLGKGNGPARVPGPTDWRFECFVPEASGRIPGLAEAVGNGREAGSADIRGEKPSVYLAAGRLLGSPELDALFFNPASASTVGHAFYDPDADILVLKSEIH